MSQSSHKTSWALTPPATRPPVHTQGKVVSAGPWRRPCVRPDSPQRGSTHPQPQAGGVHAKASPPATWSRPSAEATPRGIVQPAHCPSSCRETAGAQPSPCKALSRGTPLQLGPCPGGLKHAGESRPFGNSCQRIWAFHSEQHSCTPIFVDKFTGLCVHVGTGNQGGRSAWPEFER